MSFNFDTADFGPAENDVHFIGNAIVDILAHCDDDFLAQNQIAKSNMSLIDAQRAKELIELTSNAQKISGGSAANSAVGVANLGGASSFFGKLANDENGALYRNDLRQQKVDFYTSKEHIAAPSAISVIFVTPDGERSMNTFLGECGNVNPDDFEAAPIENSKITYFEGYLWNAQNAKKAILSACNIAHNKGRKTALTLSDAFCVEAHRDEFMGLLSDGKIDILFANEDEITTLFQTDFDSAAQSISNLCSISALTRGAKGSIVQSANERFTHDSFEIEQLVDTTGAGDMFAAGFLFGLTNGYSLEQSNKLGNFAASQIVQTLGARAKVNLRQKAQEIALL